MLLREVDRRLGLTKAAATACVDDRRKASVRHSIRDMLAQRVYGLACGNEDVSDHNSLRSDLVMQTAVGRDRPLASGPTLSRLETAAAPELAARLNEVLVDTFIASHKQPPRELVLDCAPATGSRPRCSAR